MRRPSGWWKMEFGLFTALVFVNLRFTGVVTEADFPEIRDCGKHTRCPLKGHKSSNALACRCDEDCNDYRDCCLNKVTAEYQGFQPKVKGISLRYWKCISIYKKKAFPKTYDPIMGVYAVARCPPYNKVSSLCSRHIDREQGYHFTLDLPVYSSKTGIIYANVFCAYCYDDFFNLEELKVEIKCTPPIPQNQTMKVLSEGTYQSGTRVWLLPERNCTMIPFLSDDDDFGRPCLIIQDSCPDSRTNQTEVYRCSAYSNAVVSATDNTVYKNPYCALCNGVSKKSLSCKAIDFRHSQPSLAMIMNFNWDFTGCDFPHEVFDSVHGKCHTIGLAEESCINVSTASNRSCENGEIVQQDSLTLKIEGYLTVGCLSISIICLLLHNAIFYSQSNLQNLPSSILNSLCLSLVIAQSLFLVGVNPAFWIPDCACKAIAVVLLFFFLSAFFWMNIMSFDVWTTFSHLTLRGSTTHTLRNYSIYAWGGPILVVTVAVVCDLSDWVPSIIKPRFGGYPGVCWFANRPALGLFLYLPICILLGANIAFFAVTVCWLQRQSSHAELVKQASGRKECKRLWLYAKLSTIMGLSWSFGMVASLLDRPDFWYPFILFNGLQGAFIFFMFDVKRKVMESLMKNWSSISHKGSQKSSNGHETKITSSSASNSSCQTVARI